MPFKNLENSFRCYLNNKLILFPQTLGNLHREHWLEFAPVLVVVAAVADFGIDVDSP